ncbi:DUF6759 domain-containing protein [Chryseobacterium chendengshani]|uniref:DUF6759 domain-containing protein n=1 Tax=unclassified Chryseobacterium TaxID=2593645 RepID=UPI001C644D35|nr:MULTISPECIES: DUF6759 domain-containing protein [unclassified Chryseobacterium]MBW7675727.1 competence protein ComL [Chryseobacterium sp. LJ756]MBW8524695.1 competence protein ComL [Chryseobacterium sp. LJ668]QYK15093.1 competence protein ComL [Chryseobacterium sp. LJ668]
MIKTLSISTLIILFLTNCGGTIQQTKQPAKKPAAPVISTIGTKTSPAAQTEIEYQTLIKTYKSETADVLNDLLNGSSQNSRTSIIVENQSACNTVLTISGNNYFKKIPIGAKKTASVMAPKNQNYNFSGMICNSVYQKTKFVTSSYSVKLSN